MHDIYSWEKSAKWGFKDGLSGLWFLLLIWLLKFLDKEWTYFLLRKTNWIYSVWNLRSNFQNIICIKALTLVILICLNCDLEINYFMHQNIYTLNGFDQIKLYSILFKSSDFRLDYEGNPSFIYMYMLLC